MIKPECNCQIGLFGMESACVVKLRRKGKHIGWRCITCNRWLIGDSGGYWLPKTAVIEYLKQYNADISDIPEAEND